RVRGDSGPANERTGPGVTAGAGALAAAGLVFDDTVQRREQCRIERGATGRRRRPGEVGAGGHEWRAERGAQRGNHRVRADPHRHRVVRAGDPARHPCGGGHDPGVRAGPAGVHGGAMDRGDRIPVGEAIELRAVGRDQDQALGDVALFDPQQPGHGALVEGIATNAPDALGGVSEHAAAAQQRGGGVDRQRAGHGVPQSAAFLAAAFFPAFFAVFFAAFFVVFFAAVFFFATAFFTAFFAVFFAPPSAPPLPLFFAAFLPKRPRIGLPVSSSSFVTSSRVSDFGSRSLGMRPLSLPSLMYGPKRPLSTWMSLPSNSLMIRLRAISSFSSIRNTARSRSMVYGSSSFFSEAYTLPRLANGPKRPMPTLTSSPLDWPGLRGSLNSSSASSSEIVCMLWPGRSEAKVGFSSSSAVPICAYGP